jgi:hypothetical protein
MAAFYTVVPYVPDPVRDERLNIGVLVFGDGQVRSRFVDNWHRVRNFGEERIDFLRSFARSADRLTEEEVRRVARTWHSSIRPGEGFPTLLFAVAGCRPPQG